MVTTVPLTTSSAARRLKRSEGTVRNWVRDGRLRPIATTESGVRLFDPVEIDKLALALTGKGGI